MGTLDFTVIALALALVAWVNWYFFLAERAHAAPAAARSAGVQEITIAVEGGYEPRTIRVRAGEPVRLVFDRRENASCSEEVVFGDFGIRKYLPAFEKTAVELTPPRPGTYDFTCGMSMLHGKLIAE